MLLSILICWQACLGEAHHQELHRNAGTQLLQELLEAEADRVRPGRLGVSVLDLETGKQWGVDASRRFPVMSVMKAPVAAAVLSRVDAGQLSLERQVKISAQEHIPGSAVPSLGDRIGPDGLTATVRELLRASVSESDNTSVDVLLKLIGGPSAVTHFLRAKGITALTIDASERSLRDWSGRQEAIRQKCASTSHSQEMICRQANGFLTKTPNAGTPNGGVLFLKKLWRHELLSSSSTEILLKDMRAQIVPRRLRRGVSDNIEIANKTGTGGKFGDATYAWNDIAILTWSDGRSFCVVAFLMNSTADDETKDGAIADVARAIEAFHHQ